MNKVLLIGGFALMVIAQWWVPSEMIRDYEKVLREGYEIRLKTRPVDPYDLFRGKYVYLSFEEDYVEADTAINWYDSDEIFVQFEEDSDGFSVISEVSQYAPKVNKYLKVGMSYMSETKLYVDYPFTNYYMEESKAREAEQRFNEASRDTTKATYAVVKILDGVAVLEDVRIDGVSLKDLTD